MIDKAILFIIAAAVAYLIFKIRPVNRLVKKIWRRHYELIIGILIALFVGCVILPKLLM